MHFSMQSSPVLNFQFKRPVFSSNPVDPKQQRVNDFIEAAKKGFLDTFVEILTEDNPAKKIDVNATNVIGNTALMMAAGNGYPGMVEGLLEYEANPNLQNRFGNTALMFAALNGQVESVELLLKAGADKTLKNEDGLTALDRAREYQHSKKSDPERYAKVIELLLG